MKKFAKRPKGAQAQRGIGAKLSGDITGKKNSTIPSYVLGTKPNPKLPAKSLTPKAKVSKKH